VGQLVGEPIGIQDIFITRETLVIDLRPLANPLPPAEAVQEARKNSKGGSEYSAAMTDLAQVEAVYHLDNRGAEKKLHLLFASGSEQLSDFQVWLGDQSVTCSFATDVKLPATWNPPKSTPGLGRDQNLSYPGHRFTPVSFTVVIPPGRQTL